MKSLHNTNAIQSTSTSRASLGLIIVGVVTAILCSFTLFNDTRSTDGAERRSLQLIKVSSLTLSSIKGAIFELHK